MGQRSHIVGGSLNILISFPLLTLIQYNQSLMLSWIMFFSGMDCQSPHPVSNPLEAQSKVRLFKRTFESFRIPFAFLPDQEFAILLLLLMMEREGLGSSVFTCSYAKHL